MVSWLPRTRIIRCNHVVCTLMAMRTSCGLSSTATRTSPPASPAASQASLLAWPSAWSATPASGFHVCALSSGRSKEGASSTPQSWLSLECDLETQGIVSGHLSLVPW